jgi:pyridoxamine 5'-phosphate oxidase
MTKAEILNFINANRDCSVATVEGNKPHVRVFTIFKADENGILFQTWTLKDIYEQLQKNPETELCFKDPKGGLQVRISGKLELVDDMALKKEVVAERTFMKAVVDSKGWGVVAMYRLKDGKASVWTPKVNFDPKTYIDI